MKRLASYVCATMLCFTSACFSGSTQLVVDKSRVSQTFNFSARFPAVNLSPEASFFERTQNFFSKSLGNPVVYPVPITGRFYVDNKGHSNYVVPLQLPPSISRVGVRLSLNYNSGFLKSYLGVGWRLSGFSQITLCGQNYFLDQAWSRVRTNNKSLYERNRFCLDGQRLVAIKGKYGASETIYHTEIFNGKRIRSIGNCSNGPCSFEVFDRKGNKRFYGLNSDSVIVVNSSAETKSGDVLTWALDEIVDKDGRKIDFLYQKGSQFDNTLYPVSITYGIVTGKETRGVRKIIFNYENISQTNVQNKYLALTTLQNQAEKKLRSITSTLDGKTVTAYNFQYEYNSFSRHNRLVELSYCDNISSLANKCFAHSSFEYSRMNQIPNNVSFKQTHSVSLGNFQEGGVKFVLMDKYGDGYVGLGVISHSNGSAKFQFFQNDGKGLFKQTQDSMILGEWGYDSNDLSKSYNYYILDKNGDGINDLIKIQKSDAGQTLAYSYLSDLDRINFRTEPSPKLINNKFDKNGDIHYLFKDINGDGLSDIVQLDPTQSSNNSYDIKLFYSKMQGSFSDQDNITNKITGYIAPHKNAGVDFVDIDGDGLSDLHLLVNASGKDLKGSYNVLGLPYYHYKDDFIGPKNSETGVDLGSNTEWNALPVYKWIDYNNDGLQDLLLLGYQSETVTGELFINTGGLYKNIFSNNRNQNIVTNSFILSQRQVSSETLKQQSFQNIIIGDIDGDGYPDLLHYLSQNKKDSSGKTTTTNNKFALFRNTGTTFKNLNQTQDFGDNSKNYPVDLNGDGVLDILSIKMEGREAVAISFINQSPKQYNYLLKIQNGIGRVLNLNYGQLQEVHDIDKENMPMFPYIIYRRPRMVMHSYSDQNSAGSLYSYHRKFNLRYTNGIFNRHDWQFSGFQELNNHETARDLLESRSYETIHPFRGMVKAIEIKKSSTGEKFSGHYFTHDFQHIYNPNNSPTVKLVRKLSSHNVSYYRSQKEGADQEAYRYIKKYGYDEDLSTSNGKYGNIMSISHYSQSGNKQSSVLNYCYTYLNKTDDDNWALGLKTGERASSQSSCQNFTDPETYQWDATNDLRLLQSQYDENNLRVTSSMSYFYDQNTPQNSGWVKSTHIYDNQGRIKSIVQNSTYTKANGKNSSNNKQATITLGYDNYGFIKTRQYKSDDQPEQLIKQISIDPRFGRITSVIYPSGVHIKGEFDELGLLLRVFANDPIRNIQKQVESYSYVTHGNVIYNLKQMRVNWNEDDKEKWHYHKMYYDGNQSVYKRTLRGFSEVDRVVEDSRKDQSTGRVNQTAFSYFENDTPPTLVSYTYDDRGRLQTVSRPDGFHVSYKYTYGEGTSTKKIEIPSPDQGCGKGTNLANISLTYNHTDRLLNATWPDKSTIQRKYNLFSRQIEFKDGRGLSYSWNYDSLGRVNTYTSPDAGTTTVEYSAHSRPSRYQFSNGTSMQTSHDGLGRLISHVATKGSRSSIKKYFYSEKRDQYYNTGQMTSLTLDNGVSIEYNYDSNGNIAHKTVSADGLPQRKYEFTFQYSPSKQKTMMTYPDKSFLQWNYASNGQLKTYDYTEGAQSQNLITIKSYNSSDSPSSVQYGNQMVLNYNFDNLGRVIQLKAKSSENSNLLTHNYCYNSLGLKVRRNIVSANQNITENFKYDMRGRISSHTSDLQSNNYQYDKSGNLLQKNGVSLSIAPKSNQIVSGTLSGATLSMNYDKKGHLQTKILKKDNQISKFTYNYDNFGRLAHYIFPQGDITYQYGINGHRFSRKIKLSNNTSKNSYYISPYYEIHTDSSKILQVKNMQLNSLTLASKSSSQMNFFVRDHLGSLLATTNDKGQFFTIQRYSPYGKSMNAKMDSNFEFTGKKYDQELQHYNFVHRYYDPSLGRFLTPDPLWQYSSGYNYADGQPLNGVDRNGLEFGEIISAILGIFTSAITAATSAATTTATVEAVASVAAADVVGISGATAAASVANGVLVSDAVAGSQAIVTSTSTEILVATGSSLAETASSTVSATVGSDTTQIFTAALQSNTYIESVIIQDSVSGSFEAENLSAEAAEVTGSGSEDLGSSLSETEANEFSQVGESAAQQSREGAINESGSGRVVRAQAYLKAIGRRFVIPVGKFLLENLVGMAVFSLPSIIQEQVEKHSNSNNQRNNNGFQHSNTNSQSNSFFRRSDRGRSLINTYNLSTSLGTPYGATQKKKQAKSPSLGFPIVNTRGHGLVSISDPQYFNSFHQEREGAIDYSQILIQNRNMSNHYPIYVGY